MEDRALPVVFALSKDGGTSCPALAENAQLSNSCMILFPLDLGLSRPFPKLLNCSADGILTHLNISLEQHN